MAIYGLSTGEGIQVGEGVRVYLHDSQHRKAVLRVELPESELVFRVDENGAPVGPEALRKFAVLAKRLAAI